MSEGDAIWGADEERRSEPFLEFANASADRRLLDAQSCGRAAKAAMFGRSNHILDVADLDRQIDGLTDQAPKRALVSLSSGRRRIR